MATANVNTSTEPYVGPYPFRREDEPIFFGRDREVHDLMSCVIAHSETVFYAQSGAGKTSMLNAKLLPMLEKRDFEVLPSARVQGPLQGASPKNIYVFHALMSWAGGGANPNQLAGISLAEFLKTLPHKTDEDGVARLRIAVFDQFEELFTFYPERWPERLTFFKQVRAALEDDPLLRVVFSMREDHIAEMDPYAPLMPERMRTRYRLERLRESAALEAVVRPLVPTGFSFAPGVAKRLVRNLLRTPVSSANGQTQAASAELEFVEPVQLQVICKKLWKGIQGEDEPESKIITDDYVEKCADVDAALAEFYEDCLQETMAETGVAESDLRQWFERELITPAGTRGMVFRGLHTTDRLPNHVVDKLENLYLIRPEMRGQSAWYELTHDRFIEPILASNRQWRTRQSESAQSLELFEELATQWVAEGRPGSRLLSLEQYLDARHWQRNPGLQLSHSLLALIRDSQLRFWQYSLAAVIGLVIVMVGLIIFAFQKGAEAERLRIIAEKQTKLAEQAKDQAEMKKADAEKDLANALEVKAYTEERKIYAEKRWNDAESQLAQARAEFARANRQFIAAERQRYKAELESRRAKDDFESATQKMQESERLLAQVKVDRDQLEKEKNDVSSRALAALSTLELEQDSQRGLLLALKSVEESRKPGTEPETAEQAELVLRKAYFKDPHAPRILPNASNEVHQAIFSSDGSLIAAEVEGGGFIWNLRGGEPIELDNLNGPNPALAFSPDGKWLATEYGSEQDKDGWEVMVWEAATGKKLFPLRGHENAVTHIAFAPDGKSLVTASSDHTARVWNLQTRESLVLSGHANQVNTATFSPDGRFILTASNDHTARLWDLTKRGESRVLRRQTNEPTHLNDVSAAWFSPDGKLIITTSKQVELTDSQTKTAADYSALVWNSATGAFVAELKGHESWINSTEFSPDSKLIVTASDDGTTRVWEAATGKTVKELTSEGEELSVLSATFDNTGSLILTRSDDGIARVRDVATGGVLNAYQHKNDASITAAVFSPNGRQVLTSGDDLTTLLWDTRGQKVSELKANEGALNAASFSQNGQLILATGDNGAIKVWDTNRDIEFGLPGRIVNARAIATSPDGRILAVAASNRPEVRMYSAVSGRELASLAGHTALVNRIDFSRNGRFVLTASDDGSARVWDLTPTQLRQQQTLKAKITLSGHSGAVLDAEFSPNGLYAITTGADQTVRVWDTGTQKQERFLGRLFSVADKVRFSPEPEGARFAVLGKNGKVSLFETSTGNSLAELKHVSNQSNRPLVSDITNFAFSPDGKIIATAGQDGIARIWDAKDGKLKHSLRGHRNAVLSVAFSPNGKKIVTASSDLTARIWEADDEKQLQVLTGHTRAVDSASFSKDSRLVITTGNDEDGAVARIWDAETGKLVDKLTEHSGAVTEADFISQDRILTADEEGVIRIWDNSSGRIVTAVRTAKTNVVAISPDGEIAATLDNNGRVVLTSIRSSNEQKVLTLEVEAKRNAPEILSLVFSPNGQKLAATLSDGAYIWNLSQSVGKRLTELGYRRIDNIAFSPDGQGIVVTESVRLDGAALVLDADKGQILTILVGGHLGPIKSVAFSPDGKKIVTTGNDLKLKLWEAQTGKLLSELTANTLINQIAFSPDGRWLIGAGENGQAMLWEIRSSTLIGLFEVSPGKAVKSVAFNSSGDLFVTASSDGAARIFNCDVCRPFEEVLNAASRLKTREFTDAERKRFGIK